MVIALLAPRLDRFLPADMQPRGWYVGLGIAAGVVWLGWAVVVWRRRQSARGALLWIGLVGLAMRAALFAAPPILEDDYYRYLWDGAVTASGLNPYRFSPGEVLGLSQGSAREPGQSAGGRPDAAGRPRPAASAASPRWSDGALPDHRSLTVAARPSSADVDRWAGLAGEGEHVLQRVNHPHFRTVYPPTTQAAFTLAHWIDPWAVWPMRLVLLAFDSATALLLLALLGRLGLPRAWVLFYWCNPLLIAQTVGSVHMDVIAMAFIAAALLLTLRGSILFGAVALALAVGAKVWPLMLLPLLLRYATSRGRPGANAAPLTDVGPYGGVAMNGANGGGGMKLSRPHWAVTDAGRFLLALLIFSAIVALMAWPILVAGIGPDSGFTAYTGRWDNNDALFALQRAIWQDVLPMVGVHPGHADDLTRYITAGVMIGLLVALTVRPMRSRRALIDRCLVAVAAMFLLSPTQFPWYFAWMLPLLTLRPVWPLMLYTALLPLYYLQEAWGGVVWIEHAPVLVWLSLIGVGSVVRPTDARSPLWLTSRPASR